MLSIDLVYGEASAEAGTGRSVSSQQKHDHVSQSPISGLLEK